MNFSEQEYLTFKRIVSLYRDRITQLVDCLHEEYTALRQDNQSTIENLAQRKKIIVDDFHDNEKHLVAFIQQITGNEDEPDLSQIIDSLPQSMKQEFEPLWNEIKSAAEVCKDKNMINGAIVASRISSLQRNIDVLQYGESGKKTVGYNASGEAVAVSTSSGKASA